MSRVALIVGINHYDYVSDLKGCVSDAQAMREVLAFHGDGNRNFECHLFTAADEHSAISRATLKGEIKKLFTADLETALFYFAGHGSLNELGGYLIASDSDSADEGLSLHELLVLANKSPARNKLIILDSCHSGVAGNDPHAGEMAKISAGLTVLTASGANQYSAESGGSGVFTSLLVDALQGGAANLLGDISPGSAYAHIDQSLGRLRQRPVFKANVQEFLSLRSVKPPIAVVDLRRIIEYFPVPGEEFPLDPSFEPEENGRDPGMLPPDPENTKVFSILQQYNRLNLLVPVDAPHMWHAAMNSKSCKLTPLGKHYWRLVAENLI